MIYISPIKGTRRVWEFSAYCLGLRASAVFSEAKLNYLVWVCVARVAQVALG